MIHVLSVSLTLTGFLALALSMPRHQRDLAGRLLAQGQALAARCLGWVLLVLALAADMRGLGAGYGAVAWFAHMSIGAWLTISVLHWRRA